MDQSTPAASDAQNQTPSDQPINSVQPTATQPSVQAQAAEPVQTPQQKTQISVGNVEAGASSMVQESSDAGAEDDEDELRVSPQETKNQAVSQGGGIDSQEQTIEVRPSAAEAGAAISPEIEPFVEKTSDQEKPTLSQAVQDAGVTHSGPGMIAVDENPFGVTQMPPITLQQAVVEEKKTGFKESKHWFMGLVEYIWRKLGEKEEEVKDKPVQ